MKSNLIKRQDAIDIVSFECGKWKGLAKEIAKQINALPSAQPEVETQMSLADCISRHDALSCFHDWIDQRGDVHTADEMPEYQRIEQLQSAQPDHPMVDIAKVTMAMAKKADMVAVTRCKDCKWSDWYMSADDKRYCYCYETGKGGRTENDYCSFAERRTDGTEDTD